MMVASSHSRPHIYSAQGTLEDILSAVRGIPGIGSKVSGIVDSPQYTTLGSTIVGAKDYLGDIKIQTGPFGPVGAIAGDLGTISGYAFTGLDKLKDAADSLDYIAGVIKDAPVTFAGFADTFRDIMNGLISFSTNFGQALVEEFKTVCRDDYNAYKRDEITRETYLLRCSVKMGKDILGWGVRTMANVAAFTVTVYMKQLSNFLQGGIEGAVSQFQVEIEQRPDWIPEWMRPPGWPPPEDEMEAKPPEVPLGPAPGYSGQALPEFNFEEMLAPVIEGLSPKVKGAAQDMAKFAVLTTFNIADKLKPYLEDIGEWFKTFAARVLSMLETLWENYLQPAAIRAWEYLKEKVPEWGGKLATKIWAIIGPYVDSAIQWLQEIAGLFGQKVLNFLKVRRPWMAIMRLIGIRDNNWGLFWLVVFIVSLGAAANLLIAEWFRARTHQLFTKSTEESPRYPLVEIGEVVYEKVLGDG